MTKNYANYKCMEIIDCSILSFSGPSIYSGQQTNIDGMDEGLSGGTLGNDEVRWLEKGIYILVSDTVFIEHI